MQMLGEAVHDPLRIESDLDSAPGLGLLPLDTTLDANKTLRQVHGTGGTVDGFWGCLAGLAVRGYEIHLGQTPAAGQPLLRLDERVDGSVHGDVAGTYVHGLFESEAPRRALVEALIARRGFAAPLPAEPWDDPYDRLANVLEAALELSRLTVIPVRASATSLNGG
jgi:adenosylcobyric acid synthase